MSKLVKKKIVSKAKKAVRKNVKKNDWQIALLMILIVAFIGLLVYGAYRSQTNQDTSNTVVVNDGPTKPDAPTENPEPVISNSEVDLLTSLANLEYTGAAYKVINNGVPFFDETYDVEFEIYSPLDSLGRCGVAFAAISPKTLPTEKRGDIAKVKPSGWHSYNAKEIFGQTLDDNTQHVYNRSHLIAFSLAAENANKLNLITGTRYLNLNMTDFETEVLNYVNLTGNHVLYRVTPVYRDNELVARGVLMEGKSVETNDVQFCVYLYNVQPLRDGTMIDIHYDTGEITLPN